MEVNEYDAREAIDDDEGMIADAARRIASWSENKPPVYRAAKRELLAILADPACRLAPAGDGEADREIAALRAENAIMRRALERIASWCPNTGGRLYPPTQAHAALDAAR